MNKEYDPENMHVIYSIGGTLYTAVRSIKIEKFQRYCLKCGKILPLEIKKNFYHECERPDFVKDKLGI
tara:strand:- start:142 stop:345 length:204 start_codon:yes stop_codon:yes gene_type:complete